ncbi:MAG: polyprenyl synthetase family protein, partial [Selenomonadaceae bacterium]|nr:polyprenyl synthetase family protein [Selenomonadaceae bacterium]
ILDIEQTEEKIGKPAGNDNRQGIVTLPVIRALNESPDREELERIVTDSDMTDEMLERAISIVKASDGVDFAKARADEYLQRAREALPEDLPEDIREAFLMVADFIAERDF